MEAGHVDEETAPATNGDQPRTMDQERKNRKLQRGFYIAACAFYMPILASRLMPELTGGFVVGTGRGNNLKITTKVEKL